MNVLDRAETGGLPEPALSDGGGLGEATPQGSGAGAETPRKGTTRDATLRLDPRLYQIAVLGSLLTYGMAWLGLDIQPGQAMTILAVALVTQLAGTALTGLPRFDPKSALISGLSLCLLLRTNEPWLAPLAPWPAGAVRDDELPHLAPADGHRATRPRQGGVPQFLPRDVHRAAYGAMPADDRPWWKKLWPEADGR